jgi:queuine tRNA-ribosyltransferase
VPDHFKPAKIDPNGVMFRSHLDGSAHYFTPEKSIDIQHNIGADIIFAFDECTAPGESPRYQAEALDRTHRWARQSLEHHLANAEAASTQALFGIVQGGRVEALRKESARVIGAMDFDGFGIGGSFTKNDMDKTVKAATEVLPEGKPRHLLGIGEPIDFFIGVEYGIDTFDCVSPTRVARNGAIYTKEGRFNLHNACFKEDFSPLCDDPTCYGSSFTKAYVAHLFRSEEMLAATIASAHNLHFITKLVSDIRQSLIDNRFFEFKKEFCDLYYKKEILK